MPPKIFKGMVFATAGPLDGQLTDENIALWAELRRGRFVKEFSNQVTHLLCTREHVAKRVPRIELALQQKHKRIKILHADWFELTTANNKKRDLAKYDMRAVLRRESEREAKEKRDARNRQLGLVLVNPDYYRVYKDQLNFEHQVILTRQDKEDNRVEKFELTLWESYADPKLYRFTFRYWPKQGAHKMSRTSEFSRLFEFEYKAFTYHFKKICKVDWRDRVTMAGVLTDEQAFHYSPPTMGKVVGTNLRFEYDECRRRNAALLRDVRRDESQAFGDGPDNSAGEIEAMLDGLVEQVCAEVENSVSRGDDHLAG